MRPVALVTGGGSGIGAAIVEALAAAGMDVLSSGRDRGKLERQQAAAGARGHKIVPVIMDVTDAASVREALKPYSRIDILVNNAGVYVESGFLEATVSDMTQMFVGNVQSVLVVSQTVVPLMPSGGRIINIASRAFLGAPRQSLYASSKAAVITLTRCMALELASRGILVNSISPGLIATPMTDALPPERLAAIVKMIPGGRIGKPEEVASVVAMLAGPGGGYTNGVNIIVDAGRSIGSGTGT